MDTLSNVFAENLCAWSALTAALLAGDGSGLAIVRIAGHKILITILVWKLENITMIITCHLDDVTGAEARGQWGRGGRRGRWCLFVVAGHHHWCIGNGGQIAKRSRLSFVMIWRCWWTIGMQLELRIKGCNPRVQWCSICEPKTCKRLEHNTNQNGSEKMAKIWHGHFSINFWVMMRIRWNNHFLEARGRLHSKLFKRQLTNDERARERERKRARAPPLISQGGRKEEAKSRSNYFKVWVANWSERASSMRMNNEEENERAGGGGWDHHHHNWAAPLIWRGEVKEERYFWGSHFGEANSIHPTCRVSW